MSLARQDTPGSFPPGLESPCTGAPALAHAAPFVRWAPWLLFVAVLFLLVFVPVGLMPQVVRRADLETNLDLARTSALQAKQLAAVMARDAAELPVLREELTRTEAWLIGLDELPGAGTSLARYAQEAGVVLLSVGFGPYTRLAPMEEPATGQTGGAAEAREAAEASEISTVSGLPYGQVSVEVIARGSWTNLAQFAGRLEAATPGLRIISWSMRVETDEGTYQLHVSGFFYLTGRPPMSEAHQRDVGE